MRTGCRWFEESALLRLSHGQDGNATEVEKNLKLGGVGLHRRSRPVIGASTVGPNAPNPERLNN